jgi:hypothetical protein
LTSGPSRVFGSRGSPQAYFVAAVAARSTASSYRSAGTSIRVQALHVCPEFRNAFATPFATGPPRSVPGRTTFADLPPSSSATRLIWPAHSSPTRSPTAVDPVNETIATPGWRTRASPATGPVPGTRLNTPAGSPAACTASASTYAMSGVSSAGLSTTGQPAASAAATFAIAWCSG